MSTPSSVDIGADSCGFRFVDPRTAVSLWGQYLRPHVQALLNEGNGEYLERDIFDLVETGHLHVWLAWSRDDVEGLCLSKFVQHPRVKKLVINGAAGANADAYTAEAVKEFLIFADVHGCVYPDGRPAIQIQGRKGWLKKFPREWSFKQVVMEYGR